MIFSPGMRIAVWVHDKEHPSLSGSHSTYSEWQSRFVESTDSWRAKAIALGSACEDHIAVELQKNNMNIHFGPSWMDPFIKCFDQGDLPSDKNEAKKISTKVENYLYEDGGTIQKRKINTLAQMCGARRSPRHHQRISSRRMCHPWRGIYFG